MSTRSKYTPLKRGVSNTSSSSLSKSDADRLTADASGLDTKASSTRDDGAKLEKNKSKVHFLKSICLLVVVIVDASWYKLIYFTR